jgi:cytochrome c
MQATGQIWTPSDNRCRRGRLRFARRSIVRHRILAVSTAISLSSALAAFTNGAAAQHPSPAASTQVSKRTPSASSATTPACTRDEFTAASLNKALWTTVVREDQNLRVDNGSLVIPTSNTDLYSTGGETPNIVLQSIPTGPFTATAKIAVVPRAPWQQAGLIIYSDDDNYAKVVFGARSSSVNVRQVEFLREENGSPDADLSEPLEETHPDTVYLRFTRDSTLHASYSSDGKSFTEIPTTAAIPTFADAKIGLLSLGGTGERPIIDAKFDWFELCRPAATQGSRP